MTERERQESIFLTSQFTLGGDQWLTYAALYWCKPVNSGLIPCKQTQGICQRIPALATLVRDNGLENSCNEKRSHVN